MTSNVAARLIMPGRGGSISALVEYMFLGWRIEVDRRGRFEDPPLIPLALPLSLGFSASGGGVGGKTFLLITGGALWSRATLLERLRWTRFVAA